MLCMKEEKWNTMGYHGLMLESALKHSAQLGLAQQELSDISIQTLTGSYDAVRR